MLDETNFTKFNANPCASGAVSVAGKTGVSKGENLSISAPADGWYYIIMFNNCSNFSDRNVTYARTGTNADEAIALTKISVDDYRKVSDSYEEVGHALMKAIGSEQMDQDFYIHPER